MNVTCCACESHRHRPCDGFLNLKAYLVECVASEQGDVVSGFKLYDAFGEAIRFTEYLFHYSLITISLFNSIFYLLESH